MWKKFRGESDIIIVEYDIDAFPKMDLINNKWLILKNSITNIYRQNLFRNEWRNIFQRERRNLGCFSEGSSLSLRRQGQHVTEDTAVQDDQGHQEPKNSSMMFDCSVGNSTEICQKDLFRKKSGQYQQFCCKIEHEVDTLPNFNYTTPRRIGCTIHRRTSAR